MCYNIYEICIVSLPRKPLAPTSGFSVITAILKNVYYNGKF
nr:MAG TPA: hypothetical protein [Caudoviricetes sp.]